MRSDFEDHIFPCLDFQFDVCARRICIISDSATGLDGATVCVQSGTTTELNLADYFTANSMTFTPVVFEELSEVDAAYDSGACDAYTTDASGLATS